MTKNWIPKRGHIPLWWWSRWWGRRASWLQDQDQSYSSLFPEQVGRKIGWKNNNQIFTFDFDWLSPDVDYHETHDIENGGNYEDLNKILIRSQISQSRLTMYQIKSINNFSVVALMALPFSPCSSVSPSFCLLSLNFFVLLFLPLFYKTFFLPNHSPMG